MIDQIQNKFAALKNSPDSGFLLIDKPAGEPSMRTVNALRRITGQRRIGFAGTLDPAASGLLIIGINKATKLLDYWHQFAKEYEAEITLGKVSTTYDGEGVITEGVGSELKVERKKIEKELINFIGAIEQIPPMYSAKSIGGQRLYKLARQGQEVARKKIKIQIYSIDLLEYNYPLLKIRVKCSTGTYIRSLANDIGQALGVGAYLSGLRRTAIGNFQVGNAVKVNNLTANNYSQYFIHLEN